MNKIISISMVAGNTLAVIREIVSSEFEQNFRAPGSILRGNCVASKIMGAYSRIVGAEYLRECIGTLVKEIATDDNLSLEIDPVYNLSTIFFKSIWLLKKNLSNSEKLKEGVKQNKPRI